MQVNIYFDHKMKCVQIIKPMSGFNGNWKDLVWAVTEGKYYKYIVK